ncbi:unnamed protein product [Schistocephalus solidus]|uniref:Uncharacterized protein n=1 Tax=Schistocephalus solidus TaxID=70667 RepID=A0A183SQF4_SCHSO|nr:unnamed protein product [Schistocephalus solidus]
MIKLKPIDTLNSDVVHNLSSKQLTEQQLRVLHEACFNTADALEAILFNGPSSNADTTGGCLGVEMNAAGITACEASSSIPPYLPLTFMLVTPNYSFTIALSCFTNIFSPKLLFLLRLPRESLLSPPLQRPSNPREFANCYSVLLTSTSTHLQDSAKP